MRKLSNNDPGFLKHKFEDDSSIASLKTWKVMEEKLIVLNTLQRKKKIKQFVLGLSSAAMLAGILLANLLQMTDFQSGYQMREITLNAYENNGGEKLQLAIEGRKFGTTSLTRKHESEMIQTTKTNFSSHQTSGFSQLEKKPIGHPQKTLTLIDIVPFEIPVLPGGLIVEEFEGERQIDRAKSAQWRFTFQGGLDDTRQVLTAKNAVIGDPMAGNSSRLWDFKNYTYSRPIALNVSIERRVSNRLYLRAGWDIKRMRSIAFAEPFKNQTAIKRGYLNHVGMNLGASFTLVDHKRLSLDIIAEVNIAHVKNSYSEVEELNNGEFDRTYQIERTTPSSIFGVGAQARLNYSIANRWKVSASAATLKPLHNYIDELNVYNNGFKYIYGARLGLSFEI